MLLTYGTVAGLQVLFHLDVSIVILSVSLSIMLARAGQRRSVREQLVGIAVMPIVAIAASGVGYLLLDLPWVGSALFVIAVSGGIWIRRFGPLWARIGTYVALPFIATIVVPAAVTPQSANGLFVPWAAIVALIAAGWAALVQFLAHRTGLVPRPSVPPAAPPAMSATAPPAMDRRLPASTRMAVQMAAALSSAFLLGHLLLGQHWPWAVITAYVVTSGNRGRGDVAYKGVMRVLGGVLGTVLATLLAGAFPPGDAVAILWIFVVLALGTWLRGLNYAWWAGSVTAVLALLYGYFGQGGTGFLLERILGVLIGGALAVLCAWFILPVRTTDVLRRRMFTSLAALSDVLSSAMPSVARTEPERLAHDAHRFEETVRELEQLAPTLRAADLILRVRRVESRHSHVLASLGECVAPVRSLVDAGPAPARLLGAVSKHVGALRRALATRTPPEWGEAVRPGEGRVADDQQDAVFALLAIDAAITGWRR